MIGGPGTGKSTTAAGVFHELKLSGINCELVREFAKDLVWDDRVHTLGDQLYILAKQHHRMKPLLGKVDVIATDCPLFLSVYYGQHMSEHFKELALELFRGMDNMTWFLRRTKDYNPAGRVQTEEKAKQIDDELYNLLGKYDVDFGVVPANTFAAATIAGYVLKKLRENKT